MNDLVPRDFMETSQQEMSRWSWEQLVSTGMVAREYKDLSQWILGKLALAVDTAYGDNAIGKFASEIGVNINTLQRYRWVVKHFPLVNVSEPKALPFYAYEELVTVEDPEYWMNKAIEEDLPPFKLIQQVREHKRKEKGLPPKPPHRCPKCGHQY